MPAESPFLAEDCLLPLFHEGLLTRKQTLKSYFSAAKNDPTETLAHSWQETASEYGHAPKAARR
jgi:hypothetical protein